MRLADLDVPENVSALLQELAALSRKGPVEAIGSGAPAVGMTLLSHLGVVYQSSRKPSKYGVIVSARRGSRDASPHRVNLFAAVPDWTISPYKSSSDILDEFGYERGGVRKLNCSVRSRQPNAQGLQLEISRQDGTLREVKSAGGSISHVASWRLDRLEKKLEARHPDTVWITATSSFRGGVEFFHYRYAVYTSAARYRILADLLHEGTITVDHLISRVDGRVSEKGPLFKIKPENIPMLFPTNLSFDLLTV